MQHVGQEMSTSTGVQVNLTGGNEAFLSPSRLSDTAG